MKNPATSSMVESAFPATQCGPSSTLILFSKAPVPGQVKTRLVPPLSPVDSARLHDAFVRDALSRLSLSPDYETLLAYAPDSERAYFEPFGLPLISQGTGGLGERMERCLAWAIRKPGDRAILIGTDIPTLTSEDILAAFLLLEGCDLVFGPSTDGGFFLVGLRDAVPAGLFRGVTWSASETLAQAEARVRELRLCSKRISIHRDVDTIEDLRRLRALDCGPNTQALLRELGGAIAGQGARRIPGSGRSSG